MPVLTTTNPFLSLVFIGIITFLFSFLGIFIGTKGGTFFEDKAEKIVYDYESSLSFEQKKARNRKLLNEFLEECFKEDYNGKVI